MKTSESELDFRTRTKCGSKKTRGLKLLSGPKYLDCSADLVFLVLVLKVLDVLNGYGFSVGAPFGPIKAAPQVLSLT